MRAFERLWDKFVLWMATRGQCHGNCFACEFFERCEEDFYFEDGEW